MNEMKYHCMLVKIKILHVVSMHYIGRLSKLKSVLHVISTVQAEARC